jgi:hypothetical protein
VRPGAHHTNKAEPKVKPAGQQRDKRREADAVPAATALQEYGRRAKDVCFRFFCFLFRPDGASKMSARKTLSQNIA